MPVRLVPSSGKPIKLDKPVLLIGRNPDCDVVLTASRKVSRMHCLLAVASRQVLVRDLGSTNGVWINGQRVDREARLRIGDELSIADLQFEVVHNETPMREAERERPLARGRDRKPVSDAADDSAEREVPVRSIKAPPNLAGQMKPVAIPEQEDSFVVEASMPKLPKIDVGIELNLDDDELVPKQIRRPAGDESQAAASNERGNQRRPRPDDESDDEPILPLDAFSDDGFLPLID